ncbi:MAG: M13 family metallopeptidase [Bacteroidetes bacterium]|nr:M13 family metallopeptidase [Bacteroidota bacterium]MBS1739431.1 M13 family metallopeptidase [Bacteroidota bacterium]
MQFKHSLIAGAALFACTQSAIAGGKDAGVTGAERKLLDPANMDKNIRPGDNFFLYANGTWLKNNPIPASETRWGSFNELQENNYAALHKLLEEAAQKTNADHQSADWKVGAFYRSGMNEVLINKEGLKPLQEHLNRIANIKDQQAILKEIAFEHSQGSGQVFGFYVSPDDKNVTVMIPQLFQGGLGLPDRDYYFKKDPRSEKIRNAYKVYVAKILTLMKEGTPEKTAEKIYDLESKLAAASMTRVEMRDPYKLYNKYDLAKLTAETPGINWRDMLATMKVTGQNEIIVGQPLFFQEFAKQLKETDLTTWKKYLQFHLVSDLAPYLSKEFDEARFDFYGKTVRGQQEQKPRWKRVLGVIDGSVGELLGQMYVAKNFKPEAKKRMLTLVNNLQQTYADRINRLDWMSAATKIKAIGKLNTFMKKIGYPDKWKDYSKLSIVDNDYLKNVLAASAFEYDYNISKLGKPVDRTEWGMTPPTVNAYYNPAFNEIVFPAGILQYPFFDFKADDAVNYGGIGAVIGHEMTHGFDDQGRQYDADGNLKDWWTEEDAKKFTSKTDVVVKQFNSYTVLDTVHVNGELTLGENLADLGGLAIAYEAFKKTPEGKSNNKIDGFTPDQRFFLSWAQVWRANTRPEEMASRIVTDPHSPNEWRCNGPLSNMTEFYTAFGVKPGDKMYRPTNERAKVW